MAPWTRAELEAYVLRDRPLDCAGAYKLEAGGIALFQSIECADWTAIEGLPLLWLSRRLRERR
jgi:septum formation protein